MPNYVRVRDNETGAEYSVIESAVEKDAHTVLKDEAADAGGNPLPDKPAEPKSGKATTKENS